MTSHLAPVISVKGTPFECGFQHGSQAKEIILKNINRYFELWGVLWGGKRPEILELCRGFIPVIGKYDADIMEEMEGIARGAGAMLEEIVALNARYELLWAPGATGSLETACTSLCALPSVTENAHTIMGQNWDYKLRLAGSSIVLEMEQKNKPNLIMVAEAGIVGQRGMNSAGIGLCVNALISSQDKFEAKTPFLVVMRGVLNADSFAGAIKAALSTKTSVSGNLLIGHRDGETIDLEVSPIDVGYVPAEDGILTHTNNFLALANRGDLIDVAKTILPDTLFRYSRARRLLAEEKGQITVASFQRVLKDHFSYPDSICRHINAKDPEPNQLYTHFSTIMDLHERVLYVADGPPCQNEYRKIASKILWKE